MDTERFVGQEILVPLKITGIEETEFGIKYRLKHVSDVMGIIVPAEDIKECLIVEDNNE